MDQDRARNFGLKRHETPTAAERQLQKGTLLTQSVSALGTGPVTFGNGTTLQVQNLLNASGNWTVFPGAAIANGGTCRDIR